MEFFRRLFGKKKNILKRICDQLGYDEPDRLDGKSGEYIEAARDLDYHCLTELTEIYLRLAKLLAKSESFEDMYFDKVQETFDLMNFRGSRKFVELKNITRDEHRSLSDIKTIVLPGIVNEIKENIDLLYELEPSSLRTQQFAKRVVTELNAEDEEIGDIQAIEPLVQRLDDEDSEVRKAAAESLDELEWAYKNDIEKFNYLFAKQEWDKLIKMGEHAVMPLIKALQDKHWKIRSESAKALGEIGDIQAIEPLIQALQDGDIAVQKQVIRALGKLKDVRAIEPLRQSLKSEKESVRKEATKALEAIKCSAPTFL